jgi:AraC-like DNA-binding protein
MTQISPQPQPTASRHLLRPPPEAAVLGLRAMKMDTTCPDRVSLVQRFVGDLPTSRHLREFVVANWLVRVRRWVGVPMTPVAVSFTFPPPRDPSRAARFFGVTPAYGAARVDITFPDAILDLPVSGAEPALREMFARQVEGEHARLQGDAALPERTRAEIARRLAAGTAELPAVARALSLSERTLQRRLRELGTSFQALLDEERRAVAVERIGSVDATVTDVAFLLGFSDTSAFTRAFRRWTGVTPAAFRRAGASAC